MQNIESLLSQLQDANPKIKIEAESELNTYHQDINHLQNGLQYVSQQNSNSGYIYIYFDYLKKYLLDNFTIISIDNQNQIVQLLCQTVYQFNSQLLPSYCQLIKQIAILHSSSSYIIEYFITHQIYSIYTIMALSELISNKDIYNKLNRAQINEMIQNSVQVFKYVEIHQMSLVIFLFRIIFKKEKQLPQDIIQIIFNQYINLIDKYPDQHILLANFSNLIRIMPLDNCQVNILLQKLQNIFSNNLNNILINDKHYSYKIGKLLWKIFQNETQNLNKYKQLIQCIIINLLFLNQQEYFQLNDNFILKKTRCQGYKLLSLLFKCNNIDPNQLFNDIKYLLQIQFSKDISEFTEIVYKEVYYSLLIESLQYISKNFITQSIVQELITNLEKQQQDLFPLQIQSVKLLQKLYETNIVRLNNNKLLIELLSRNLASAVQQPQYFCHLVYFLSSLNVPIYYFVNPLHQIVQQYYYSLIKIQDKQLILEVLIAINKVYTNDTKILINLIQDEWNIGLNYNNESVLVMILKVLTQICASWSINQLQKVIDIIISISCTCFDLKILAKLSFNLMIRLLQQLVLQNYIPEETIPIEVYKLQKLIQNNITDEDEQELQTNSIHIYYYLLQLGIIEIESAFKFLTQNASLLVQKHFFSTLPLLFTKLKNSEILFEIAQLYTFLISEYCTCNSDQLFNNGEMLSELIAGLVILDQNNYNIKQILTVIQQNNEQQYFIFFQDGLNYIINRAYNYINYAIRINEIIQLREDLVYDLQNLSLDKNNVNQLIQQLVSNLVKNNYSLYTNIYQTLQFFYNVEFIIGQKFQNQNIFDTEKCNLIEQLQLE